MVALAAVVIAAALWRPVRHGAILLAGAIIPMVAQAISALIQVGQVPSPTQFGFTPAQASQLGLTITAGLTPAFWIYCVFVAALVVSCAWMLVTPREAAAPVGAGAAAGDGADAEVPAWHVAGAGAYDVAGTRPPGLDDRDLDISDDAEDDDFDSHEDLDDDPAGDTTVPGRAGDQADPPASRD
jgi:hypothetical protein